VVLVDDHALVRAGIRDLVKAFRGVEVVGEARDGREALTVIAQQKPDVVLMDISMPNLNGLLAVRRIYQEFPGVRVVILSVHDSQEHVLQALHAGAAGYVIKGAEPEELETALRSVYASGSYISPAVSGHILADYAQRSADSPSALARLTPRQLEILQLIAEGHTNQEIASLMGLGIKTVESHRAQLMERLDIHDVAGLVRFAMRTGVIDGDH
jgi:DNA-binding NarL/FixJ family response regulator